MKRLFKIFPLFLILILVYAYVCNINAIPQNVVVMEGEKLNLKVLTGLSIIDNEAKPTSSNLNKQSLSNIGTNSIELKLFGKLNVKNVSVDVIPKTKVIPLGNIIGMKLYTKGVLVVGMSEIENENSKKEKPFANSGIEEGSSIISINNKEIFTTEELINEVNNSDGEELYIKYVKHNELLETTITPVKSKDNYKIGLWVRDAAAGVGTLTFYEPSTNMFMSLGHGIVDIDTGELVNIANGELVSANIVSIIKGQKDIPGEMRGTISNGYTIGDIYKNTDLGVYGKIRNNQNFTGVGLKEMDVASRDEIHEGKAVMLCQLDNSYPKEYEIEIEKIYIENNKDNKSMMIKITDQDLLNKTGGIIQGMSGAPIIQNGKFIGAVTNVLVKDPTQGYAIFGDLLIKQMREV